MGQQIFIPNAGGTGGESSLFLTDLYDDGAYVDYGLPAGGADVFYTTQTHFTACLMFRVVQENRLGENIPLLTVSDAAGNGFKFFINPLNKVCAQVNDSLFIPERCELPLGRVFHATLTVEVGGGEFYLGGRELVTQGIVEVPPVAPVTLTMGPVGSWTKDFVEYIGFGYLRRFLSFGINEDEGADLYMACQNAGKVVFPPSIVFDTPLAVYNAEDGLMNPALWVPSVNTLGAPDLPAVPNGIPVGTLHRAPFFAAHSGWSDVPAP